MGDSQKVLEETKEEIKRILILALILLLVGLVTSVVIFIWHGVSFTKHDPSKYYGPTGVCPYDYSSFGLASASSGPIIGVVVDAVVSIIYSSDGGNKTGFLNAYRGAILNNTNFQIVKILLIVLAIGISGASFVFGFSKINSADLLKRFGIIALVIWATDPNTYQFYDDFIDPLVLKGSKELAALLARALLSTIDTPEILAYANRYPDNEFVLLDAALTIIFSETIFNKIGAMIFTSLASASPVLALFSGFIYMTGGYLAYNFFMLAFTVIFYKIVMVVGLSMFPMFALFGVSMAMGKQIDKFSVFFVNYIQETLIKPAIAIAILIFGASLLTLLILKFLTGMFSFQVCLKTYFYLSIFSLGNYDYFYALKPTNFSEIYGSIIGISDNPAFFSSDNTTIERMVILNLLAIVILTAVFKKLLAITQQALDGLGIGSSLARDSGLEADMKQLQGKIEKGVDMGGTIARNFLSSGAKSLRGKVGNLLFGSSNPNKPTPTPPTPTGTPPTPTGTPDSNTSTETPDQKEADENDNKDSPNAEGPNAEGEGKNQGKGKVGNEGGQGSQKSKSSKVVKSKGLAKTSATKNSPQGKGGINNANNTNSTKESNAKNSTLGRQAPTTEGLKNIGNDAGEGFLGNQENSFNDEMHNQEGDLFKNESPDYTDYEEGGDGDFNDGDFNDGEDEEDDGDFNDGEGYEESAIRDTENNPSATAAEDGKTNIASGDVSENIDKNPSSNEEYVSKQEQASGYYKEGLGELSKNASEGESYPQNYEQHKSSEDVRTETTTSPETPKDVFVERGINEESKQEQVSGSLGELSKNASEGESYPQNYEQHKSSEDVGTETTTSPETLNDVFAGSNINEANTNLNEVANTDLDSAFDTHLNDSASATADKTESIASETQVEKLAKVNEKMQKHEQLLEKIAAEIDKNKNNDK